MYWSHRKGRKYSSERPGMRGEMKILEENSVAEDGQYLKEADGMSQQHTAEPWVIVLKEKNYMFGHA